MALDEVFSRSFQWELNLPVLKVSLGKLPWNSGEKYQIDKLVINCQ